VVNVDELARQIEYKVAPEPLIAVQALANTFDLTDDEELLLDPAAARLWLIESDLALSGVVVGEAELRLLRESRELIRELIDANLTGDPGKGAQIAMAELAARHPVELTVDDDGELSLDLAPAATVDGLISQMVGIVFQAQLRGEWPRLKICACDDCRWAFFDSSRNRGGTWCQMEVCGNRIKNRAYRRRNATSASGPVG
jgi:predicted RNA-binding Zn ribbon-like protein